jgi:hypothetical protein
MTSDPNVKKFTTVTVDDKGRVGLGREAAGFYRVTFHVDGKIVLEPARVYTEAELAVLKDPEVSEALEKTFSHPNDLEGTD